MLWLACFLSAILPGSEAAGPDSARNNWAIIVSTSRYWFNYRHAADALAIYQRIRESGVADDRILLMLGEDPSSDPRNTQPGRVPLNDDPETDGVYGRDVEADFTGAGVSARSFLALLTGSVSSESTPLSRRLETDSESNVLVYLTGHGGDGFLKFHDRSEMTGEDLAGAIAQMHARRLFKRMLLIVDTCNAESLTALCAAPGLITVASSKANQKSRSLGMSDTMGVHLMDRFAQRAHELLGRASARTLELRDFFSLFPQSLIGSETVYRDHGDMGGGRRSPGYSEPVVNDFFGSRIRGRLVSFPRPDVLRSAT